MSAHPSFRPSSGQKESPWLRRLLIAAVLTFLGIFLVLPLVCIFAQAFRKGPAAYWAAIADPAALSALRLTLRAAAIAVPVNLLFGLAAAWAIARFTFSAKGFLVALIDLPFSISPVVAGLMYVLVYSRDGVLGKWLEAIGWQVIFAPPAIILATLFVTLPFAARILLPFMQAQGKEEEEAAVLLGASGGSLLWRIILPNIRWPLFYGAVLTAARAMGEFGAVSMVSGHIRGKTNTLTLHVEMLYHEYQFSAAFAAASLLTLVALIALVCKTLLEKQTQAWRCAGAWAAAPRKTHGD